jgi:hypothetical protein
VLNVERFFSVERPHPQPLLDFQLPIADFQLADL